MCTEASIFYRHVNLMRFTALPLGDRRGSRYEPRDDKTNKVSVSPVKTQISLGVRPVTLLVLSCGGPYLIDGLPREWVFIVFVFLMKYKVAVLLGRIFPLKIGC